jgi:hypothetical protein
MYFSQVSIENKQFVDGGLVANNPCELAIFEAHHLFEDRNIEWFVSVVVGIIQFPISADDVRGSIVSIGTGLPGREAGSVNIFKMLSEIIDICTSSNAIHERVKEWICMMPEPRPAYFRLNPMNGEGSLPLDTSDVKILQKVEASTEEYLKMPATREMVDRIKAILMARDSNGLVGQATSPKPQTPAHSRLDKSL